jgi:DNA-binding beta-propeller fold protein YncE
VSPTTAWTVNMTASLIHRISSAAAFFPGKFTAVLLIVLAVLFCVPTSANAQIIVQNGENANDLLGQFTSATVDTTNDYVKGCPDAGASPLGFDMPDGSAIDATYHWLYVADTGNNRVLVFPLTTGNVLSSKTASYVLGQPNLVSCTANRGGGTTPSSSSLSGPTGVSVDATDQLLYVADLGNNRVMVFDTSSLATGEVATYVLGQSSWSAHTAATSATGLSSPSGVAVNEPQGLLYVADTANNRVMIYISAALSSGMAASYEFGQPTGTAFTSKTAATSASGLSKPGDVAIDSANQKLYVADYSNNRVEVFSISSPSNAEPATWEIGQLTGTAFTSKTAAETQAGLKGPINVTVDTTHNRLFVSDTGNHRVMVYSTPVSANGPPATFVLGSTSWTSDADNYQSGTQSQFQGYTAGPEGMAYDSTNDKLYVADSANAASTDPGNNRVMIFNTSATVPTASSPTQSGQDACGIASGMLYCWGDNPYGEDGLGNAEAGTQFLTPQQVGSLTTWTSVSEGDPDASNADGSGLQSNGTLWCWGQNANGEDGVGNTTEQNSPVQEDTLSTNWTAVSQGGSDTCGIKGGTLWCWGANNSGQDGLNNGDAQVSSPTQVGAATTWTKISQSGYDACGIQTGGALYCWGTNSNGEDGVLNTTEQDSPVQVGNSNTVFVTTAAVASGAIGSVAAANTVCQSAATAAGLGGVYKAWIASTTGTDDPNTTFTHSTVPYKDVAGNTIAANWAGLISGTLSHGIGINQAGGTVTANTKVWTNVAAATGAASTTGASATASCTGWTSNGTPVGTHGGDYGLTGSTTSTWSYSSNIACSTATNHLYCFQQDGGNAWASVSQGEEDTCAITTGGKLYCWGANTSGEVGVGNTTEYKNPTQVGALTTWTAVSVSNATNGWGNACGIAGGTLYCWGDNTYDQLGIGTNGGTYKTPTAVTTPPSPATATGWTDLNFQSSDGCGINNGELYCWGWNNLGEDGTGPANPNLSPVAVPLDILVSGENATDLLGQYTTVAGATVDWFQNGVNNGPNATTFGFYWPGGIALDGVNHVLYVSDTNYNRVLVYHLNTDNSISTASGGHTPSFIIGGDGGNEISAAYGAGNASLPGGLAVDTVSTPNRLFMADQLNNRVEVWNLPITANYQAANYVLGAPSMGYYAGGCTSLLETSPTDVAYDSAHTNLYVSDMGCKRVLVYSVATGFASGEAASYAIGQASLTASTSATTQAGLNVPYAVAYDSANSRLFVADEGANRVMVYSTAALSTGMPATNVIGQTSWTASAAATTQTSLNLPRGLSYDANNNRLFVADTANERVLVYNAAPSVLPVNNASATYVLGQSSWTTSTVALTQSGLNLYDGQGSFGSFGQSSGITYDPGSGRLFVVDGGNNRVMIFPAEAMPSWPPIMAP